MNGCPGPRVIVQMGVTLTPDEVTYNHEWNAPGVSSNRKRKTTVDQSFLA